MKQGPEI